MSMQWVRDTYKVPAKRGGRVRYQWTKRTATEGRITRATNYVHVRFDGERQVYRIHPTDDALTYLPPNAHAERRASEVEK